MILPGQGCGDGRVPAEADAHAAAEPTQGWVCKQPFYLDEESKGVPRQCKEGGFITARLGGGAASGITRPLWVTRSSGGVFPPPRWQIGTELGFALGKTGRAGPRPGWARAHLHPAAGQGTARLPGEISADFIPRGPPRHPAMGQESGEREENAASLHAPSFWH